MKYMDHVRKKILLVISIVLCLLLGSCSPWESDLENVYQAAQKEDKNAMFAVVRHYDDFKDVQIKAYGKVIDYVRGITNGSTNTIMILTIEDQLKYTTHKNATLDDTLKMILHEVVHACNSVVSKFYYQTAWLQEGLATNLANQNYFLMDLSECDFELLKNDFINYGKNNYAFAYTIVNFILNNYDKEIVYKLITDTNYLKDNDNRLFEEAKQHMLNEKLSKR